MNLRKLSTLILASTFLTAAAQEVTDSISDPQTENLDELVVVKKKPIIQANGEKTTYNVDEDPASNSLTLIDMLRKVPMVTVDGEDNVKVNGQGNFKILVNGKENPSISKNASTVFKAMPASSVKKIEVITEPGAKYDAEGTGAILNLITTSGNNMEGYLATVKLSGGNKNSSGDVYFCTNYKNVTASINYTASAGYPGYSEINTVRTTNNSSPLLTTIDDNRQKQKNLYQSGAFNLSWEPNQKNLFTVSATLMHINGKTKLRTVTDNWADDHKISSLGQNLNSKWVWGNVNATAAWQHFFNSENHYLLLSYMYDHGSNQQNSDIEYRNLLNSPLTYPYVNQLIKNPTNEHTFQIDYNLPITDRHLLEIGAKGIFRRNPGFGQDSYGTSPDDLAINEAGITDIRQFQDIAAAYLSYSGTYGKFNIKAGLRYEHTHHGIDFLNDPAQNFRHNLNDVVPNAAIGYNFSPLTSLRLSYQMKISRPNLQQVNPHKDIENPLYVSYGNPDLKSVHDNGLTLTYTNYGLPVGLNLSLGYYRADNMISSFLFMKDGVMYSTFENAGLYQSTFFNAYLNFNLWPKVQLGVFGTVRYQDYCYKAANARNHGWSGQFNVNFGYTMPGDINLNVFAGGAKQEIKLQQKVGFISWYGLSVSRGFLKEKRLNVTLAAYNMFKKMHITGNIWTADTYADLSMRIPNQMVSLSVSYRFGSLTKKVRQTSSKIVNDDIDRSSGKKE